MRVPPALDIGFVVLAHAPRSNTTNAIGACAFRVSIIQPPNGLSLTGASRTRNSKSREPWRGWRPATVAFEHF
jgi:hypothetical protein